MMKIAEAQTYLETHGMSVSVETLRRWIKSGKLAGEMVNRRYVVDQAALDALLGEEEAPQAVVKPEPVAGKHTVVVARKQVRSAVINLVKESSIQKRLLAKVDQEIFGKGMYRFRMKLTAEVLADKVVWPEIDWQLPVTVSKPDAQAIANQLVTYLAQQAA